MEEIAGKANLNDNSKYVCKELDELLKSVEDNFSDKMDYLNLMIKLFSKMVKRKLLRRPVIDVALFRSNFGGIKMQSRSLIPSLASEEKKRH